MITQVSPKVLIGLASELPAASGINEGVFFHASDDPTKSYLLVINPATGAHRWDILSGGGSWPKYVVSNNPDIPAPYSTIGAANAAAKAANHGPSNPCAILVHPGVFNENVVLTPGISVVGFVPANALTLTAAPSNPFVQINGRVTMDTTAYAGLVEAVLANVSVFAPHNQDAINLNGPNVVLLALINVFATTAGGNNVVDITNLNNPVLAANGCTFEQPDPLSAAISVAPGTSPSVLISDCTIQAQSSGNACGVRGNWTISDTNVTGGFLLVGGFLTVNGASELTTNGVALFTLDGTSSVRFYDSTYSVGANDSLAAGSGQFTFNNVLCTNNVSPTLSFQNTIVQETPEYQPSGYTLSFVNNAQGNIAVPIADLIFFALTGLGTADLPDTRTFGHGRRMTLKTNGAFALTVQAAAGDGIDASGTTSFSIAAAATPPFHATTIQCDAILRTWFVVYGV